jgi:hypothetical protein
MGRTCSREAEARKLARSGAGDPGLRAHVAECDACRETIAVAGWMQAFAASRLEAAALPNPDYLWWKAQILRRWEDERAVVKPLEVGERVQIGIGLVGALLLLVWLWRQIQPQALGSSVAVVLVLSGLVLAAAAVVACLSFFRTSGIGHLLVDNLPVRR